MAPAQPDDYADYSDTVLYDVFYEAGTALGAALVALKRRDRVSDPDRAEAWHEEHLQIGRDRRTISAEDRSAQIEAIRRWQQRRDELQQADRSHVVLGAQASTTTT